MSDTQIENAIILAAGQGTRLKPLTDNAPKCFTEVNGVTIIENMLLNLSITGVKNCTIVTGYMAEKIVNGIGDSYKSIKINYVHNDRYKSTNDMYSLWMAAETLKKGAIVLESDIFFNKDVIQKAIKTMLHKSYYIAGKYNGKKGEVLLIANNDKKIEKLKVLNKNESAEIKENHFMSSGLIVFQKDYAAKLIKWLDDAVRSQNTNVLFDHIIGNNIDKGDLFIHEILHHEWVEIDTPEDLSRAEDIFK